MKYIDESLATGEHVVDRFRLHWMNKVPMVLWLVLAIPTFGITLIFALYEYLSLRCTELGVTNKRVIVKRGIISRKTDEMRLSAIETVEVDQGILHRLLGAGHVRVSGRGVSSVELKRVDNPIGVKRAVESAIDVRQ